MSSSVIYSSATTSTSIFSESSKSSVIPTSSSTSGSSESENNRSDCWHFISDKTLITVVAPQGKHVFISNIQSCSTS
nr:ALI_HP1_G0000140.mRNA.1.CDS.1 [Saccharomyces cerevisiae]